MAHNRAPENEHILHMLTTRLSFGARALTLVALVSLMPAAQAHELSAASRKEVDQLLARVGASGCEFYRAGTWHNAVDARSHLERKFRYMTTRNMLGSADQFVADAATRSSFMGESYAIRCGNAPAQPSATWLNTQLRAMRQAAAAASQARN